MEVIQDDEAVKALSMMSSSHETLAPERMRQPQQNYHHDDDDETENDDDVVEMIAAGNYEDLRQQSIRLERQSSSRRDFQSDVSIKKEKHIEKSSRNMQHQSDINEEEVWEEVPDWVLKEGSSSSSPPSKAKALPMPPRLGNKVKGQQPDHSDVSKAINGLIDEREEEDEDNSSAFLEDVIQEQVSHYGFREGGEIAEGQEQQQPPEASAAAGALLLVESAENRKHAAAAAPRRAATNTNNNSKTPGLLENVKRLAASKKRPPGDGEDAVEPPVRTSSTSSSRTSSREVMPGAVRVGGCAPFTNRRQRNTTNDSQQELSNSNHGEAPVIEQSGDDAAVSVTIVDQSDLEAEFQQRMMANVIEPLHVVAEKDIEQQNEEALLRGVGQPPSSSTHSSSGGRKKWLVIFVALCLVLVVGVVTGIIVAGGGDSAVTVVRGDDDSLLEGQARTEREYLEQLLLSTLNENEPSLDSIYNDVPRTLALNWLLNIDEYLPRPFGDGDDADEELLLERFALAVVAFATGGTMSWTHPLNFLSATVSVCDWYQANVLGGFAGVECNGEGRVASLRIENNNLVGTLPDDFQYLTFVEQVRLVGGDLQGSIPATLAGLDNLRRLTLSNLGLTGSIPTSFEAEGVRFHTLDFSRNQLSGIVSDRLVDGGAMTMAVLDLSKNRFTGTLPTLITQSELQIYHMDGNLLTGTIPFTVYAQPRLESLRLGNNLLEGTIARQVGLLTELTCLDLSHNKDMVGNIPTTIRELRNLEELYLQGNALSGSLPSQLAKLDELRHLDLSNNRFTALPADFEDMEELRYLSIASNRNIGGSLPASLAQLATLEQLILTDTSISDGLDVACSREKNLGLPPMLVEADCGGSSPEVDCPCCTKCCSSEVDEEEAPVCTANVTAICSVSRSMWLQKELAASLTCACSEDGTNLFCTDAQCEGSCTADNGESMVCLSDATYGFTSDAQSGEQYVFQNALVLEHATSDGESSPPDGAFNLVIEEHLDEESCTARLNDELCLKCTRVTCDDDGTSGYDVVCDNLEGIDNLPLNSFSTCSESGSWLSPQGSGDGAMSCIRFMDAL